jgi:putative endonuclease
VLLTKIVMRSLEFANRLFPARQPKHLLTGKRGELEAYLHLRSLGYTIVASNFRVPYDRGEIDLIGWDDGILCFIEVKTRTDAGLAPPVTAVDRSKRRHILSVARRYVRRFPEAGRRSAASTSSALFWRRKAASLRLPCTRGPSLGTRIRREPTTGDGTSAIGASGGEDKCLWDRR